MNSTHLQTQLNLPEMSTGVLRMPKVTRDMVSVLEDVMNDGWSVKCLPETTLMECMALEDNIQQLRDVIDEANKMQFDVDEERLTKEDVQHDLDDLRSEASLMFEELKADVNELIKERIDSFA